jgi:hypothetical protein
MIPITDVVQPADVQALATRAEADAVSFVGAHQVDVVDLATLEDAVRIRADIGARKKVISDQLAKPKAWAHGLHRWFCDLEKAALAPLDRLDAYEAQQIRAFKVAEDRRRDDEARRLAADQRRVDEARAAVEAAQLETAGESAMAAAVLDDAISAPPPVVAVPDATRGIAKFVRRWRWKYAGGPEDVAATPPALIARTMAIIPRDFLTVDEIKVGAYARGMKNSATVPGLDFYAVDDPVR